MTPGRRTPFSLAFQVTALPDPETLGSVIRKHLGPMRSQQLMLSMQAYTSRWAELLTAEFRAMEARGSRSPTEPELVALVERVEDNIRKASN